MPHVATEPCPSGIVLRPGRILVVDDEVRIARLLEEALGERNQVVVASDAEDALLRLASGERFDVVLCDVRMPCMDGMEFHRRLREVLPAEADRVVFTSGDAWATDVVEYFEGLPNLVLEKPIDLAGLDALIERRIRVDAPAELSA